MSDGDTVNSQKPRKRGLTEVTLGWLAERLRKTESIKTKLAEGSYEVDTRKVAKAIVDPVGAPDEGK
jgi:anti-sigma28 factor (negative regulator of flagellin synthesis)